MSHASNAENGFIIKLRVKVSTNIITKYDKEFYKTNSKLAKGRKTYITWEEDESSFSSSDSSSDDESLLEKIPFTLVGKIILPRFYMRGNEVRHKILLLFPSGKVPLREKLN